LVAGAVGRDDRRNLARHPHAGSFARVGVAMVVHFIGLAVAPFLFLRQEGRRNIGLTSGLSVAWAGMAILCGVVAGVVIGVLGMWWYGESDHNWFVTVRDTMLRDAPAPRVGGPAALCRARCSRRDLQPDRRRAVLSRRVREFRHDGRRPSPPPCGLRQCSGSCICFTTAWQWVRRGWRSSQSRPWRGFYSPLA
jgi:hypothetical protein